MYSLGRNAEGQLGLGIEPDQKEIQVPQLVMPLFGKKVTKITCGGSHTLALTSKNEVYAWGCGKNGRCSFESQQNEPTPKVVELVHPEPLPEDTKTLIACGWSHSIITKKLSKAPYSYVFTFGRGDSGQLGHGVPQHELRPRIVEDFIGMRIAAAEGGYYHSTVLSEDGQVFCFGYSSEGQCGQGDTVSQYRYVIEYIKCAKPIDLSMLLVLAILFLPSIVVNSIM